MGGKKENLFSPICDNRAHVRKVQADSQATQALDGAGRVADAVEISEELRCGHRRRLCENGLELVA